MAGKAEKKSEAAPAAESAESKEKAKEGLLTKLPVLLGGVMVIEALVLGLGFWALRPKPPLAQGASLMTPDGPGGSGTTKSKTVEVPVGDYKALNRTNGRTFLYDLSIVVVVKAENEQKVTEAFKDGKALIEERIRTIIAESDPDKLGGGSEPGLETLHRQVKYQLDRIVGDGLIEEVLVPRCIPFRTDY